MLHSRELFAEARDSSVYTESHSKCCKNASMGQIAHHDCWQPHKTVRFEVWELQGEVTKRYTSYHVEGRELKNMADCRANF